MFQGDLFLLCFYLVFVKTAALTLSLEAVTSAAVYWFKYKAFLGKLHKSVTQKHLLRSSTSGSQTQGVIRVCDH